MNATGRFLFQGSIAALEYAFGYGFERFRGAKSYELDPAGQLFAIPAIGWYVGLEHNWNEKWKSVVAFSRAELDLPSGFNPAQIDTAEYFVANLLYSPSKSMKFGLVYLYGTRADFNAAFGDASRLQMGVWIFLP